MLGFSSDAISRMKRQSRLLTTYVIGQGGSTVSTVGNRLYCYPMVEQGGLC